MDLSPKICKWLVLNKHMEKKLAIKEKQMKTTFRYYFETKMRLLNQKTITGFGENVKKLEPSYLMKTENGSPNLGKVWQFPKMLTIELLYHLEIYLQVYKSKRMQRCVHTKTCTKMFTAAIFMTAKN